MTQIFSEVLRRLRFTATGRERGEPVDIVRVPRAELLDLLDHFDRLDDDARRPTFQLRVQPWMMACFGQEISADRVERGDRFLEEVFELLQSGGYDPGRVLPLRDYVWSREPGEPPQEAGGVQVTMAAYCLAHGLDMHEAGETELARIWTKVEQIRAKQAAKPKHSPLPVPEPEPVADAVDAQRIHEVMDEEGHNGAACGWQPCTGCHETNEGAETGLYPYSKAFGCHVGAGCGECGGIGVVWHHYSATALANMQADAPEPVPTPDGALTDALLLQLRGCLSRVVDGTVPVPVEYIEGSIAALADGWREDAHVIAVIERELGDWVCDGPDEQETTVSGLIKAEREAFRAAAPAAKPEGE